MVTMIDGDAMLNCTLDILCTEKNSEAYSASPEWTVKLLKKNILIRYSLYLCGYIDRLKHRNRIFPLISL